MNRIFIRSAGAVSPAGWGVPPLLDALRVETPLPLQELRTPSSDRRFAVRLVPAPATRPAWFAHPRLRRASAISQFAVAAALEAIQPWPGRELGSVRLGIVTGTHTASIRYSERFFGEVLQNPATASPLMFPETVINAPASHLAAFLGCAGLCYSVIGDQTAFAQALSVGCGWLQDARVDACLVLGVDEAGWTVAEGLGQHSRRIALSEGAGAVLLARDPGAEPAVELERVTDAHLFSAAASRQPAALAMRRQLPTEQPGEVLVDSRCGAARLDRPEAAAWADWQGSRVTPRRVLGEALSAATAWQFVAAHAALVGGAAAANISMVGGNLQAIGARLVRSGVAVSPAG